MQRLVLATGTVALGATAAFFALTPPSLAKTTKFSVNTTDDTVDADVGDGQAADADGRTSLRAAIMEANAATGRVLIQLGNGESYKLSLAGAGEDAGATGDLDITGDIEIQGKKSTLDCDMLDRAFDVQETGNLTVKDLTVTNGLVTDDSGGAFRTVGTLRIDKCALEGNAATGAGASGGGIFNNGGTLTVSKTTFDAGNATRAGGGIEANEGSVSTISQCDFTSNMAGPSPGNGGGIHITGAGNMEISKSTFSGNTAALEGGGIWNGSGSMEVKDCRITDNTASGDASDDGGGGIFNNGGTLTIVGSTISGNSAPGAAGSGGGVFNNGGTLEITKSTISDNSSVRAGGGVEALGGTSDISKTKLFGNETGGAPGNGGALHLTGEGTVDVDKCDVAGNIAAAEGGGLWNSSGGTMTVTKTKFRDNAAGGNDSDQGGGALFNAGGVMNVEKCKLDRNSATGTSGSGGGILNDGGMLDVDKCGFKGNTSIRAGGAIETNSGTVTGEKSKFVGNSTGDAPGNGGGLHVTGDANVTLEKPNFQKNSAANEGGGIWNSGTGTIVVTGGKVTKNTAPDGPDLFNVGGSFTFNGDDVPATNPE